MPFVALENYIIPSKQDCNLKVHLNEPQQSLFEILAEMAYICSIVHLGSSEN